MTSFIAILETMIENEKSMRIRAIADTLDCPYETVYYVVRLSFESTSDYSGMYYYPQA